MYPYMGHVMRKSVRSDINWAVQPQKMARDLKFGIGSRGIIPGLCSQNKSTDQMHMQKQAFS